MLKKCLKYCTLFMVNAERTHHFHATLAEWATDMLFQNRRMVLIVAKKTTVIAWRFGSRF